MNMLKTPPTITPAGARLVRGIVSAHDLEEKPTLEDLAEQRMHAKRKLLFTGRKAASFEKRAARHAQIIEYLKTGKFIDDQISKALNIPFGTAKNDLDLLKAVGSIQAGKIEKKSRNNRAPTAYWVEA
ncbi:hypothetical protein UFOVP891_23 [uncultured Caudovirales phage]|uniref:Uncharacterized protein n=1 Tax=uncultured Caudovirales phage TaxID=2100421 RepID=A0A6J5T4A7_9CAUD|nr:hypothetical protein UFOVP472_45 [uncultured Caudovirales phage]CAB4169029.1 hypothetical protein UFOVP891_23 [uncultured Caudovirales phage]CAB4180785.1 hypothetical protein UFOVP1053_45 [uncultured Caudovirales phage]CAB4195686.1 hypothetical protein UFOVP1297_29 [uncultured Caudovirales phage]CAB4221871.1 hypothetical protein UFOVP1647_7 [uncultured Caudovirales phage]